MALDDNADTLIASMGAAARTAARFLARAPSARKSVALRSAADHIRQHSAAILSANQHDMAAARLAGLSDALLDRLLLNEARLAAMAASVAAVADLRDPVGMVIDETMRPNGMRLTRVRVPLGVIGVIFESRPNVTADAGALCLKSGNAVILRGGSEARLTCAAIHDAMVAGIMAEGLPADAIQLVPVADRAMVGAMLVAHGLIDVIIPRGGKALVARVQADARVPVLAHLDGVNHTYIDAQADPAKARDIVVNAKMRRPGICGATETVLIDRAFPVPEAVVRALLDAGCEVRGTPPIAALDRRVQPASDVDWDTEYLDAVCSVALVDGVEGALAHIARHGSDHTDAIITESTPVAEHFLQAVDSAIAIWNASTQFADGGEFGMGAEIGIATGRLHARGPVALEGLTTYKWQVRGNGQVRA